MDTTGTNVTDQRQHDCARRQPGIVTDDPAGALSTSLARHIADARLLAAMRKRVSDQEGWLAWLVAREVWIRTSLETLGESFAREAVTEFVLATGADSAPAKPTRADEESVRTGLEVLVALRKSLRHNGMPRSSATCAGGRS